LSAAVRLKRMKTLSRYKKRRESRLMLLSELLSVRKKLSKKGVEKSWSTFDTGHSRNISLGDLANSSIATSERRIGKGNSTPLIVGNGTQQKPRKIIIPEKDLHNFVEVHTGVSLTLHVVHLLAVVLRGVASVAPLVVPVVLRAASVVPLVAPVELRVLTGRLQHLEKRLGTQMRHKNGLPSPKHLRIRPLQIHRLRLKPPQSLQHLPMINPQAWKTSLPQMRRLPQKEKYLQRAKLLQKTMLLQK
jgi:hypothetical protein